MKILDFVKEMKQRATRELLAVSEGGKCIEKTYTFQKGQAEIITICGGAIEKAAITHLILKSVKAPGTDVELDGMVYQMEVFPENPYCPMGHFNTEWRMGDTVTYYMNLDLFPAANIKEELDTVKGIMDGVADKFGRDKTAIREGLGEQYNMAHWSFPLAAKVGCQLKELKESDLDLFTTAYHTFFNAYMDILRKKKNTQFSEEEQRNKLQRNGKWLEYITIKDRAIKMAQAVGIPPEVIIGLSYPPSAVF
jgi:coproporphyrinogen III oxidase